MAFKVKWRGFFGGTCGSYATPNLRTYLPPEKAANSDDFVFDNQIIVHQHPTGDPTPSSEDISITRRLKEAGEIMGIRLVDHIIVGDGTYLSFVERGLL